MAEDGDAGENGDDDKNGAKGPALFSPGMSVPMSGSVWLLSFLIVSSCCARRAGGLGLCRAPRVPVMSV